MSKQLDPNTLFVLADEIAKYRDRVTPLLGSKEMSTASFIDAVTGDIAASCRRHANQATKGDIAISPRPRTMRVEVSFFKESGKWYTDETYEIPDDAQRGTSRSTCRRTVFSG